jgi:hypothetical protein
MKERHRPDLYLLGRIYPIPGIRPRHTGLPDQAYPLGLAWPVRQARLFVRLVGTTAPKVVTIAGMELFLEKVVPEGQSPSGAQKLYKYWLEQTKAFAAEGFGVCDEQEIDGIVPAMRTYSEQRELCWG